MATHYVDPSEVGGGDNSNDGSTFALRKKTFGGVTTAVGDTVRIKASPDPYRVKGLNATNANGTFTNLDDDIAISETFCKIVHECDAAATAAANVTAGTSASTFKAGTAAWQITVAAGFTTGLAAHSATVNGDYSDCDRISFWMYQSSGTAIPASTLDVRLCSDTAGATVVDTFTIPFVLASGSNLWSPIELTRNGGGSLGAGIQSISIAFTSDPGAVVLFLDNIIATNSTGITHQSLVSKDSSATSLQFWPVRTISATNIKLDADINSNGATAKRGYSGTTETVAIYARKPLITYTAQVPVSNGVAGSRITWSGGWNDTDMSTQTGVSYLLRLPSAPAQVSFDSRSHFNAEWIGVIGGWFASFGLSSATNCTLTSCAAVNSPLGFPMTLSNTTALVDCVAIGNTTGFQTSTSATATTLTDCEAYNNATGFNLATTWVQPSSLTGCIANNNATGISLPSISFQFPITNCTVMNNSTGFTSTLASGNVDIYNVTTASNSSMVSINNGGDHVTFWGGSIGESQSGAVAAFSTAYATRIRFHRYGNVQTDERERTNEGWILKVDDSGWAGTGHTPSGSVWRLQPNSNSNANIPLICMFEPGVLPAASYTVTLKAYRTNANVTGKLVVKGGRTDGISSDTASADISAAINTSETLSLAFTVSTEGPVWLEFHAWFTSGSTGEVWFDEIAIT